MTLDATKFSRGKLSVYMGTPAQTQKSVNAAESEYNGVAGWTWINPSNNLLISKAQTGSGAEGQAFNQYQCTLKINNQVVKSGLVLQSSETGKYVAATSVQTTEGDKTGFAATAESIDDAARFAAYDISSINTFYWWYNPSTTLWVGLINYPTTEYGGNGVVVASSITNSTPYLLPWAGQTADPEWSYTPPLGWQVSNGSDLSYIDFTQTTNTIFSFDFTQCVLDNTNLLDKDFAYAKFVSCDLSATKLQPPLGATSQGWIDFTSASIPFTSLGSDWRYLKLSSVSIIGSPSENDDPINAAGAQVDNVTLPSWQMSNANFAGANLLSSNFLGSDLQGASFKNAIMTPQDDSLKVLAPGEVASTSGVPTQLSQTNLVGANFTGAQIKGVQFIDATLTGVDFSVVDSKDLTGVHFARAMLKDCVFNQTKMMGTNLSGATLVGAKLAGVQFAKTDQVIGADLSSAYLPNAVLTGANLNGVTLSYSQIYGSNAKLDNANLANANLANANLASMDLTQARMSGVVLTGANLIDCTLKGADLTDADMTKASLQGADLTDAKLYGAHLSNAAVALTQGVVLFSLASKFATTLNDEEINSDLQTAFTNAGYPLSSSAKVAVFKENSQWSISEDPPDSANSPGFGYIGFMLVQEKSSITVYGTSLAVVRLGDDNQLDPTVVGVLPTKLDSSSLSNTTTCPNQNTYAENNSLRIGWEAMMTAPGLPHPPACIPTPTHWCSTIIEGQSEFDKMKLI